MQVPGLGDPDILLVLRSGSCFCKAKWSEVCLVSNPDLRWAALDVSPSSQAKRCRLFGSSSVPSAVGRTTQKRMERSQEEDSPGKCKKRKSLPGVPAEDSTVGAWAPDGVMEH